MVPEKLGIKGEKKSPNLSTEVRAQSGMEEELPSPFPFQNHTDGIEENTTFLRKT